MWHVSLNRSESFSRSSLLRSNSHRKGSIGFTKSNMTAIAANCWVEKKRGSLKSGRSAKKITSRKQAIAIGLSEARKKGKKVPKSPRDQIHAASASRLPLVQRVWKGSGRSPMRSLSRAGTDSLDLTIAQLSTRVRFAKCGSLRQAVPRHSPTWAGSASR
jgi:hypothetical protein